MNQQIVRNFAEAKDRLILLDYDGTITPLMPTPEQAAPSVELRELLGDLASKAQVVIISGRDHRKLDEWLGDLPLDFAAEHGLFYRENEGKWLAKRSTSEDWKQSVRPLMQGLVKSTSLSGSILEETTGTLNWHYRNVADQDAARAKAELLIEDLKPLVQELNLGMLDGSKVVTVKLGGVDKGLVAQHWLQKRKWDFIMAAGDDKTDEFLFKAMPPSAYTIKIGKGETNAREHLESPEELLILLRTLAQAKDQ